MKYLLVVILAFLSSCDSGSPTKAKPVKVPLKVLADAESVAKVGTIDTCNVTITGNDFSGGPILTFSLIMTSKPGLEFISLEGVNGAVTEFVIDEVDGGGSRFNSQIRYDPGINEAGTIAYVTYNVIGPPGPSGIAFSAALLNTGLPVVSATQGAFIQIIE